jgi:hypothetical protein
MGACLEWTVSMISAFDSLQEDRHDAEVAMAEMAVDDDRRHAFIGHLDGVGVAQLSGAKGPAHASPRCGPSELGEGRGA